MSTASAAPVYCKLVVVATSSITAIGSAMTLVIECRTRSVNFRPVYCPGTTWSTAAVEIGKHPGRLVRFWVFAARMSAGCIFPPNHTLGPSRGACAGPAGLAPSWACGEAHREARCYGGGQRSRWG
jgi:hypothetical protein